MAPRKQVCAQEYLEAHNRELQRHPRYRADMNYTQVRPNGDLVMNTRDKVLAPEDREVFEEVSKLVAQCYELIFQ